MRHSDPEGLPVPSGFSQTIQEGSLVVISGQLPVDADRMLVATDFDAQCRRVFANVGVALSANGCGWADVLRIGTYLTSAEDYHEFCRIREEVLSPPFPTSTMAIVAGLVFPGARIEMEALASRPG